MNPNLRRWVLGAVLGIGALGSGGVSAAEPVNPVPAYEEAKKVYKELTQSGLAGKGKSARGSFSRR